MTTKKKGLLTVSGEWCKHLRWFGKKQFWNKERRATRELIIKEKNDENGKIYTRNYGG